MATSGGSITITELELERSAERSPFTLSSWHWCLLLAKSPVTSNQDPTPGGLWSQTIEGVLRDCPASVFGQGWCKPPQSQSPISFLGYIQGRRSQGGPPMSSVFCSASGRFFEPRSQYFPSETESLKEVQARAGRVFTYTVAVSAADRASVLVKM